MQAYKQCEIKKNLLVTLLHQLSFGFPMKEAQSNEMSTHVACKAFQFLDNSFDYDQKINAALCTYVFHSIVFLSFQSWFECVHSENLRNTLWSKWFCLPNSVCACFDNLGLFRFIRKITKQCMCTNVFVCPTSGEGTKFYYHDYIIEK